MPGAVNSSHKNNLRKTRAQLIQELVSIEVKTANHELRLRHLQDECENQVDKHRKQLAEVSSRYPAKMRLQRE